MTLYKYASDALTAVEVKTMEILGIKERDDLQRLLSENINVVSPNTLIFAEEYSNWRDSKRRIDLLGIDSDGSIVVIELKRTEDGGHMDLQAIRYAAMVSTLTFDQVLEAYEIFCSHKGIECDCRDVLLSHLETCEPEEIGERTRIVLVSADFNSEISTAVLWLNEQGLNISCVRLTSYRDMDSIYFDAQQIIPLPEARDYMVKSKEKAEVRKAVRIERNRDYRLFVVSQHDERLEPLNKRNAMLALITRFVSAGINPRDLQANMGRNRFVYSEGVVKSESQFARLDLFSLKRGSQVEFDDRRFFCKDDQLIHAGECTYALSNQWGVSFFAVAKKLCGEFPKAGLSIEEVTG